MIAELGSKKRQDSRQNHPYEADFLNLQDINIQSSLFYHLFVNWFQRQRW
jgi:hypothetical protein